MNEAGVDRFMERLTDAARRPCMASYRYPEGITAFCTLKRGHGPLDDGRRHDFRTEEEIKGIKQT